MRIVHDVVLNLMVILCSIELSFQFDCLPNGGSIPGFSRGHPTPPLSDGRNSTVSSLPPARPYSPLRSSPSTENSQRARSRSSPVRYIGQPTRLPSADGHGYGLDQLAFIRIIPNRNPNLLFVLRRYTFPPNERIKVFSARNVYRPVPNQEQIVLSTSDGDVFAILSSRENLVGIYAYNRQIRASKRVKMNMESGTITALTKNEIDQIPVNPSRRISSDFRVVHTNHSDRPPSPPISRHAEPSSSIAGSRYQVYRCIAPPTRLPSSDGKGYGMNHLQFIILTSFQNVNRKFKFQKYTFPADRKLLLHGGPNQYMPMPRHEHIVLSTPADNVYAILESTKYLAGIYAYVNAVGHNVRVKINIRDKTISPLTTDDIREIPVGRRRPILNCFTVQHDNHTDPRH